MKARTIRVNLESYLMTNYDKLRLDTWLRTYYKGKFILSEWIILAENSNPLCLEADQTTSGQNQYFYYGDKVNEENNYSRVE